MCAGLARPLTIALSQSGYVTVTGCVLAFDTFMPFHPQRTLVTRQFSQPRFTECLIHADLNVASVTARSVSKVVEGKGVEFHQINFFGVHFLSDYIFTISDFFLM